jgi:hypothetical protein
VSSILLIGVVVLVFFALVALAGGTVRSYGGNRLLMMGLIAVLLLVLAAGGAIFAVRSSQTRLLITVSPGTEYVGRVTVDGNEHDIAGNETRTFTYSGKHIVFTVILVDPSRTLLVEYGGRNVKTPYGAHGEIMRDSIWSGGAVLGGLDEDDWNRAAADLIPGYVERALPPAADAASSGPR